VTSGVLDHYKVEIKAWRKALAGTGWLSIGKLARGSLKAVCEAWRPGARKSAPDGGPRRTRRGPEEYCWGREFIDLVDGLSRVWWRKPQQFVPCAASGGLVPRMYSIASSQKMHRDNVGRTTVRGGSGYESHGAVAGRVFAQGWAAWRNVLR